MFESINVCDGVLGCLERLRVRDKEEPRIKGEETDDISKNIFSMNADKLELESFTHDIELLSINEKLSIEADDLGAIINHYIKNDIYNRDNVSKIIENIENKRSVSLVNIILAGKVYLDILKLNRDIIQDIIDGSEDIKKYKYDTLKAEEKRFNIININENHFGGVEYQNYKQNTMNKGSSNKQMVAEAETNYTSSSLFSRENSNKGFYNNSENSSNVFPMPDYEIETNNLTDNYKESYRSKEEKNNDDIFSSIRMSEIVNKDPDSELTENHQEDNSNLRRRPFIFEDQRNCNEDMVDSIMGCLLGRNTESSAKPIIQNQNYYEQPLQVNYPDYNLSLRPGKKPCTAENLDADRPFICTHSGCNSAFKRFEHLKRHYRIHTGERPYKCKYPGCNRSFARSDNLNQHARIHGPSISKRKGLRKC